MGEILREGILDHLSKVDHLTFLIALVLIGINIYAREVIIDILAFLILVFALLYDVYEFYFLPSQ